MKIKQYWSAFFLIFPGVVFADGTTVTSEFVITNRTIDSSDFISTDNTASFTDVGNGLFRINDKYTDATRNVRQYGNFQFGYYRKSSLVSITMKGKALGHTFVVRGKQANSVIDIVTVTTLNYYSDQFNSGCTTITPWGAGHNYDGGNGGIRYTITSSTDVTQDCAGKTSFWRYPPELTILDAVGVSRDFYLDIGRLQNELAYRKAPPDVYVGTGVHTGDILMNRGGGGYTARYTNNVTIIKNPYFENVSLPAGNNEFNTRTISNDIYGELTVPYVINGQFTPYNTIVLNVTSVGGFNLKQVAGTSSIPYSLNIKTGSQTAYSIAKSGVAQGAVTIKNLNSDSNALRGEFNADFVVDKNTIQVGDYKDVLTAVFQISL